MNIVLIGMPGVGKSTIGVLLAKATGRSFVDTDLIIQTEQGRKLCELLADGGAEGFKRIENGVLERLEAEGAVVATGGSAVFCESGMRKLKENGVTVYLRVPLAELEKRLGNIKTRGVVMREGETLAGLLAERAPLYEKYADAVVDENGDAESTVAAVMKTLEKFAL